MPAAGNRPWTRLPHGLRLTVRLTPRADRDAIEGIAELADGRAVLKARVRAVPEKGRANKALVALLAKTAKLPRSDIVLESGDTQRVKIFRLEGDPGSLEDRLSHAAAITTACMREEGRHEED